ncbi:unnamed protein product [Brassica rapa subsp. narinosa]
MKKVLRVYGGVLRLVRLLPATQGHTTPSTRGRFR